MNFDQWNLTDAENKQVLDHLNRFRQFLPAPPDTQLAREGFVFLRGGSLVEGVPQKAIEIAARVPVVDGWPVWPGFERRASDTAC